MRLARNAPASPIWYANLCITVLDSAIRSRSKESIAVYKYFTEKGFDDPVFEGLVSAFRYERTYFVSGQKRRFISLGPNR